PGAVDRDVTQASLGTTVCAPGYLRRKADIAPRTAARVYAAYGVTANLRGHYTLSTLVPLEVGGTTSTANLWPRLHGQGSDDSSWLTIVHQHLCRHDLALDTARSLFPDPATWQRTRHGTRLPATTSPAP